MTDLLRPAEHFILFYDLKNMNLIGHTSSLSSWRQLEPDCSRCMSKVWNAKGVLFETEEDRPSSLCVVMKGTTCNVEQVLVGSVR